MSGGTINIGGVADLNVDGRFGSAVTSASVAGDAAGGNINVTAYNNGTITTGRMELNANAYGQDGTGSGGGDGDGGNVYVNADSGGSITVNGNLAARAQGSGGAAAGTGISGGIGDGGYVQMSVGNGSIDVTGNAVLSTSAWGGSVDDGNSSAVGGDGLRRLCPNDVRRTRLDQDRGNERTFGRKHGAATARPEATPMAALPASVAIDGSINLGAPTYMSAQGFGGNANVGFGGLVATAEAERLRLKRVPIRLSRISRRPPRTITGGDAIVDASGSGGSSGAGDGGNVLAGAGGNGDGGVADVFAHVDGASLNLGNVSVLSDGIGGFGGRVDRTRPAARGGIGSGGISQVALMDPFQDNGTNGQHELLAASKVRARGVGGTGGNGRQRRKRRDRR